MITTPKMGIIVNIYKEYKQVIFHSIPNGNESIFKIKCKKKLHRNSNKLKNKKFTFYNIVVREKVRDQDGDERKLYKMPYGQYALLNISITETELKSSRSFTRISDRGKKVIILQCVLASDGYYNR